MQQFTVPQFIDVEDKIIGPVTTRQFVIIMAGFILISICYKIFDFSAFAFFGLIIFGITGIFAFLRINGRPFHFFVLNFVQTMKRPALRVWNSHYGKELFDNDDVDIHVVKPKKRQISAFEENFKRSYTKSHLAELALIVDTKGAYQGERNADIMDIKAI